MEITILSIKAEEAKIIFQWGVNLAFLGTSSLVGPLCFAVQWVQWPW